MNTPDTRPCPYCAEYLCDECEAAILGPGAEDDDILDFEDADFDETSWHDEGCPCDLCHEARIETAVLFDMGKLP